LQAQRPSSNGRSHQAGIEQLIAMQFWPMALLRSIAALLNIL
jgi:hypothetical protein